MESQKFSSVKRVPVFKYRILNSTKIRLDLETLVKIIKSQFIAS
jgi:hypothetical protein